MLGKLGIDARLLLWQIVNFAILFLILRKFAWRPLVAALNTRAARVAASLRAAAEAERERSRAERESARIAAEAHERASGIITAAEKEAARIRNHLRQMAEAEARSLVTAAHRAIERERKHMIAGAEREIGSLALLAARRAVEEAAPELPLEPFVTRALRKLRTSEEVRR